MLTCHPCHCLCPKDPAQSFSHSELWSIWSTKQGHPSSFMKFKSLKAIRNLAGHVTQCPPKLVCMVSLTSVFHLLFEHQEWQEVLCLTRQTTLRWTVHIVTCFLFMLIWNSLPVTFTQWFYFCFLEATWAVCTLCHTTALQKDCLLEIHHLSKRWLTSDLQSRGITE